MLVVPAWAGFVHTLLHRPHPVLLHGRTLWLPDVAFVTVATLACSLITFLCAWLAYRDEITSLRSWFLIGLHGCPFIGMIVLLNPSAAGPPYP